MRCFSSSSYPASGSGASRSRSSGGIEHPEQSVGRRLAHPVDLAEEGAKEPLDVAAREQGPVELLELADGVGDREEPPGFASTVHGPQRQVAAGRDGGVDEFAQAASAGPATCRPTHLSPRLTGCAVVSTSGPAAVPGRMEASGSTTSAGAAAASSTATSPAARLGAPESSATSPTTSAGRPPDPPGAAAAEAGAPAIAAVPQGGPGVRPQRRARRPAGHVVCPLAETCNGMAPTASGSGTTSSVTVAATAASVHNLPYGSGLTATMAPGP